VGSGCALALHGAGIFALAFSLRGVHALPELDTVDVAPIDEATARQVLEALGPMPDDASPPTAISQVVRLPVGHDDSSPTGETRYIAEADSNTDRERKRTGSPLVSNLTPPVRGVRSEPVPVERPAQAVREAVVAPVARKPARPSGTPEAPVAPQGELAEAGSASPATPSATLPAAEAPATPAPRAPVGMIVVGIGGGVEDHLPDVPDGGDTALRARRSALAGFINQVRDKVRQRWHPSDVYKRADPTGALLRAAEDGRARGADSPASKPARRTVLQVRIRSDGSLERADVFVPSGLTLLDEEAQSAFEGAQPFSAPPREFLDGAGMLSFQFEFYLDLEVAAFRSGMRAAIRREWHPAKAFKGFGDRDRITVVRLLLTFDGIVAHAAVETSSGLEILDENAMHTFKRGMKLPSPPAALGEVAGLVPVHVAFRHSMRGDHEVQILRDPRL
jgi:outer membrane biosynthesis protein TonB